LEQKLIITIMHGQQHIKTQLCVCVCAYVCKTQILSFQSMS